MSIASLELPEQAVALLKGPRRQILELAAEPITAVELAARLDAPRQRIGYHVRQLLSAGLLKEVRESRRGAMVERSYRTSAESFTLSPDLLGPLAANVDSGDRASAAHLIGALHRVQREVCSSLDRAAAHGERLPTLTLSSQVRFRDAGQRAAFASAIAAAMTDLVARHTQPFEPATASSTDAGSETERGAPYRLTLTLHPTPP